MLSPACQELTFTAHADSVSGEFVGLTQGPDSPDPGEPLRGERGGYDFRPQIVGVFTDLSGPAPPGLEFSATIDSRYSTSPTLLKVLAMIVGVAMTIIALGALHVLDNADGMRHRRFLPQRWWSLSGLDALVVTALFRDVLGGQHELPVGALTAGGDGAPSPVLAIVGNLLSSQVAFRFISAGDWRVDDVFVDPYSKG